MSGVSWSALVGPIRSRKAASARLLAADLRGRGIAVGGFVQAEVCRAGELVGYDLENLDTREFVPLARRGTVGDVCDFCFDSEGLAVGASWLCAERYPVVIAGAVGKLEAGGKGHWPGIERALSMSRHVVLCVRDTCLTSVALALPDPVAWADVPACEAEIAALAEAIAARVRMS